MGMHNPPHPGEILLEDVIPGLGITILRWRDVSGLPEKLFQEYCTAMHR